MAVLLLFLSDDYPNVPFTLNGVPQECYYIHVCAVVT